MTAEESANHSESTVSVIGLGSMGSGIARALVDNGVATTVWNRTAERADDLVKAGASAAATVAEAMAASPVAVICVRDSAAVAEILADLEPGPDGRTIVNVTSGSPAQARAHADRIAEHGGAYLDGTIMGDPQDVGSARVRFAFSGDPVAFEAHRAVLELLGDVGYRGKDPGAPAVDFLAQVAFGYEMLIGFLHTVRLVTNEGSDAEEFTERLAGSLAGYEGVLKTIATAVTNGDYVPDLGPLDVQEALMDDLIEHRESAGVEALRMREVRDLMRLRIAEGHGDEGFSSLFEVLGSSDGAR